MTELSVVSGVTKTPLTIFLDLLFEGGEGYVYSPVKKDTAFTQFFFEWPAERVELHDHILRSTADADVYIAPALFNGPGNAEKSNVKYARTYWADFDGVLPSDLKGVPAPTLRVVTSNDGHEHWYWRTDEWLNAEALENTNRAVTYILGADGSGWDANQVLRPPGTINHKRNRTTRLVKADDSVYGRMDFSAFVAPPRIADELALAEIPDAYEVVMKYPWSNQAMNLYRARGEDQDRSAALMQLGYFCAEMGMADAEMFSILRNADDRWGKFKNRTDRDRRLVDLISTARVKHQGPAVGTDLRTYGLKSLLDHVSNLTWVIEGLLQERGYLLMTGRSGVGKTQLSLRFAINLALGRDFIGYKVGEPKRILFFSLEMGLDDLQYFLKIMSPQITEEELTILEQNLLFVPLGESLYLNKPEIQREVEKLLSDVDPHGVFFDSLGSMSDEELSNESLVKSIMDWDSKIRKRYNLFTWYIHHQRKAQAANKKPTDLSDVYGSHYITARATSVYCLWPEGDQIEVSCLKRRLSAKEKTYRLERHTADLNFSRLDNEALLVAALETSSFMLEEDTKVDISDPGFGLSL